MDTSEKRCKMIDTLFPNGIPSLWCPMLVHYDSAGRLDHSHIERHISTMCRKIHTFLLFGSTGDGWELRDAEKEELLLFCIKLAETYHFQMLIGVLEPERKASASKIKDWIAWLRRYTGCAEDEKALQQAHICGFTVCAPRGASLSQSEIVEDLREVLNIGVPTAIYQLSQITLNEIETETVCLLADEYSNFYLFKDTSGTDRVILSGLDFQKVFFVRGAESNYDYWSTFSGGRYPGFLLSSANVFSEELSDVLSLLKQGETDSARKLSQRISHTIEEIFQNTSSFPYGNVFTNSIKCIDHIFAYGKDWREFSPPVLHCGKLLPPEMLEFAAKTLETYGWNPQRGYLTSI